MYTDYRTTKGGSLAPALFRYNNLADMLEASESLVDLDIVKRDMEIAELEYGDLWQAYAGPLAKKYHGRFMILGQSLLKAA